MRLPFQSNALRARQAAGFTLIEMMISVAVLAVITVYMTGMLMQQSRGYEVVEDVSTELDGMEIKIAFVPVTPANRLQKVESGEIDVECGSTTGNVQRKKEVAFSPVFFVAGTKLMVPKSSQVRSYRDLGGKTVVVKLDGKLAMAVIPASPKGVFDMLKHAAGVMRVVSATRRNASSGR